MNAMNALPQYVERLAVLHGHPKPQWTHNAAPGGMKGAGPYGYLYLIESNPGRNPLSERFDLHAGGLRTRLRFYYAEAWGLQFWGQGADALAYDLSAAWAGAEANDIAHALGFTVQSASGIAAVDDAVAAVSKRTAHRRMALDLDIRFLRTLTRTQSEAGGVIATVPVSLRTENETRNLEIEEAQ